MAREWPDQQFFPGARLTLRVRLDNLLDEDVIKGQVPPKPSKNVKGIKDDRAPLKAVQDPDAPAGVTRFLITAGGGASGSQTKPRGVGSNARSADLHTFELPGIIPSKADLGVNGIRLADTLTVEIPWRDMPFDPRVVRSCAVFYFLGTLTPQDYARGIRGERRAPGQHGAGEPLNMIPETWTDASGQARSNLRFEGWVDRWVMNWTGEAPVVKLDCSDNTRLLLDQQHPPQLSIDPKKPIDEAVAGLLSHFPQMEGFAVEYRPTTVRNEKVPPRIGQALTGAAAVPGLGPPMSKMGGAGGGEQGSVWDYLTDIVGALGHSIRVEGTTIIIQRPRYLYSAQSSARADDPYQGRSLPSGDYPVRAFIYGRNISELEIGHEYTRKKVTNVEVRSYVPELKSPVVGRFPEKQGKGRVIAANPGDGVADQKWTVFRISGVRDPKLVGKVAEDIYNVFGRQELMVRVRTKNLASFGGGNADPDLLDLRAGDSFEVHVNRAPVATATAHEEALTGLGAAAELLKGLGYSDELADAYGQVYANANIQKAFRVKEAKVSWDIESGVGIEVVGVNYMEARLDRNRADFATDPDEAPTAPK